MVNGQQAGPEQPEDDEPPQPLRQPRMVIDPDAVAAAMRQLREIAVPVMGQVSSYLVALGSAVTDLLRDLDPLVRWLQAHPELWTRPDEQPVPCRCLCSLMHRTGICAGETDLLTGRRLSGAILRPVGGSWQALEHFDELDARDDTTGTMLVCGPCAADRSGLLLAVVECAARPAALLEPVASWAGRVGSA